MRQINLDILRLKHSEYKTRCYRAKMSHTCRKYLYTWDDIINCTMRMTMLPSGNIDFIDQNRIQNIRTEM